MSSSIPRTQLQTRNVYAGLYYPIIVAGVTFIGSLLLKETRHVLIWEETEGDPTQQAKNDPRVADCNPTRATASLTWAAAVLP